MQAGFTKEEVLPIYSTMQYKNNWNRKLEAIRLLCRLQGSIWYDGQRDDNDEEKKHPRWISKLNLINIPRNNKPSENKSWSRIYILNDNGSQARIYTETNPIFNLYFRNRRTSTLRSNGGNCNRKTKKLNIRIRRWLGASLKRNKKWNGLSKDLKKKIILNVQKSKIIKYYKGGGWGWEKLIKWT